MTGAPLSQRQFDFVALLTLVTIFLLSTLPGCEVRPVLLLSDIDVDFGSVELGQSSTRTLEIQNISPQDVQLLALSLLTENPDFSVAWEGGELGVLSAPFILASNTAIDIDITYTPSAEGPAEAVLLVYDDRHHSVSRDGSPGLAVNEDGGWNERIPIQAAGQAVPRLCLSTTDLAFGQLQGGEELVLDVEAENCGFGTLDLGQLTIEPVDQGFSIVDAGDDLSESSLARDESAAVQIRFSPPGVFEWAAELHVPSIKPGADPDQNPGIVDLSGEGPEPVGPMAVCGPNQEVIAPNSPTLDGTASFDPDGLEPLTYQWSLTVPEGSSATLTDPSQAQPAFDVDLLGTYVAELRVFNSEEDPSDLTCTTTITAIDNNELRVEMFWTHPNDDMDLHLLQTPSSALGSAEDCYFGNCTPRTGPLDWGVPGETIDNPRLDIDDIDGVGPENINLESPAAGTYAVVVRDFPDSEYLPANAVTVRIYQLGTLRETFEFSLEGERDNYYVATIEWPGAIITPCSGLGGC